MFVHRQHKYFSVALMALLAMYFVIYAFLPLFAPDIPNSPDEMANRFFAERFAERGELWFFEEKNIIADERIVPRSMRIVDSFTVPGGFIGLPVIFGGAAKAFGKGIIPFLTPLLAVLATLAWGVLVTRIVEGDGMPRRRASAIGVVAMALLLANPAWWYVASRTLMPNALFVSLVIFAATFWVVRPIASLLSSATDGGSRLRIADPALAGITLVLALTVRASEAYWIAGVLVYLLVIFRHSLRWRDLIAMALAGLFTAVPFAILHHSTYGSLFVSGYGQGVGAPGLAIPSGGLGMRLLGPLQPFLFPLGFAPRTAFATFLTYGVWFFWWWSAAVVAALVWGAVRVRRSSAPMGRMLRAMLGTGAIVTLWLILFYGSYRVQDNPDPSAVSIGSSYLRYWLPIAVLSTVPVAMAIVHLARKVPARFRAQTVGAIVTLFALAAGLTVFYAPHEGLLTVRDTLTRYAIEKEISLGYIESNAIMVVDHADKIFFPDRQVIQPLRDEGTYAALGVLADKVPLYYFGITLPDVDLAYLRDERLPPLGLTIEPVETFAEETLYRLPVVTRTK